MYPKQNINPDRWRLFLLDVGGCEDSIYMMKTGAYIPLSGKPFPHDPLSFPHLNTWQRAAALEVVYQMSRKAKSWGRFQAIRVHVQLPDNFSFFTHRSSFRNPNREHLDGFSTPPTIGRVPVLMIEFSIIVLL